MLDRQCFSHSYLTRFAAALVIIGALVALPQPTSGQQSGSPILSPAHDRRSAVFTPKLKAPPQPTPGPNLKKAPRRPASIGGTARRPLGWNAERSRSALRRDRAAAREWRRLLLAAAPWLRNGQQARLLDSWQIRLIDGDTFAYGEQRIRIRGLDAPEATESGGFAATQRLDLLLHEGPVHIVPHAEDIYGRTIADVFVNDRNVADVMREEGYAK